METTQAVEPTKGIFPCLLMADNARAKWRELRARPTPTNEALSNNAFHLFETLSEEEKNRLVKPAFRKMREEMTDEDVIARWPALTSGLIAESLGYATPDCAARIILDAIRGRKNFCEWVDACYGGDPWKPIRNAIRTRRYHNDCMADKKQALVLVVQQVVNGQRPLLASWF